MVTLGAGLGFILSSMSIDILTLVGKKLYDLANKLKRSPPFSYLYKKKDCKQKMKNSSNLDVSVVIPVYNEEGMIEKTVEAAFNQTQSPKEVIVIDDHSTDRTPEICEELKNKYTNLILIRQFQNNGKSYNINQVLREMELSEITMVLDSDTILSKNYIEEIKKPFMDENVVVVTGKTFSIKPESLKGRIINNGKIYQFKFFNFRKVAQDIRNAISVICGDSSAYRTKFLKEAGGLPEGTQTEDMDITWYALEQGYRIRFQNSAYAESVDPETITGHWKQIFRWFSGGFQCIYKHGRTIFKSKKLSLTTIIPILIDTIFYSPVFLSLPILFLFFPSFVFGFLLGDFILTVIFAVVIDRSGIKHIPEIYFVKFLWTTAWMVACIKTSIEYVTGRRSSWSGKWRRAEDRTISKPSYELPVLRLSWIEKHQGWFIALYVCIALLYILLSK